MTPTNTTPTFDRSVPTADRDLLEASPSTGWRELCAIFDVDTDVEPPPDALAAARRDDRPARYRSKHLLGVTT